MTSRTPRACTSPENAWGFRITDAVPDERGRLLELLEALFWLNLNVLFLRIVPLRDGHARIEVYCLDVGPDAPRARNESKRVRELLAEKLPGHKPNVKRVDPVRDAVQQAHEQEDRCVTDPPDGATHVLAIETLNAPGILCAVASRLLAHGIDIRAFRQRSGRQHRVREVQEARIHFRVGNTADRTEADLGNLEFELPSITGVVNARISRVLEQSAANGMA